MSYKVDIRRQGKQSQPLRSERAMKMKISTISAGNAKVTINGEAVGYVAKTESGKWEARRTHDALTVGKFFPEFATRKAAAESLI